MFSKKCHGLAHGCCDSRLCTSPHERHLWFEKVHLLLPRRECGLFFFFGPISSRMIGMSPGQGQLYPPSPLLVHVHRGTATARVARSTPFQPFPNPQNPSVLGPVAVSPQWFFSFVAMCFNPCPRALTRHPSRVVCVETVLSSTLSSPTSACTAPWRLSRVTLK